MTAGATARLRRLPATLRLSVRGAGLSLQLEALLQRLAGPLAALAMFAALAMMGLAARLNGALRVALLAALLLGLAAALVRALRSLPVPPLQARLRRLEQVSRLPAGSLLLQVDEPADGDAAQPFWQRAVAQVPQRVGLPWPRLSRLSGGVQRWMPLLLLLLLAAPLVGGRSSLANLAAGFSPWPTSLAGVQITATLRPPRYTDLPPQPVLLTGGGTAQLEAMRGSDLLLRLTGVSGKVQVSSVVLAAQPDGSQAGLLPLRQSGTVKLRQGLRTIATLQVRLRADSAPIVAFAGKPQVMAGGALAVRYRFADDYGLEALAVVATDGRHADVQLLPSPQGARGEAQAWRDFTPSRFAGKKVQLFLVGRDAQRNFGTSAPVQLTLPQRSFHHPVAQQIVGVRAGLFGNSPNFAAISRALDILSRNTSAYGGNLTVFSALRMIGHRLARPEAAVQIGSSAGILWEAALDLEGGSNLASLRSAFEQLQQAMRLGQNVAPALAALQRQLADFMAQVAQQQAPAESPSARQPMIGSQDLDRMLTDIAARLAAGDQAGAQQMLAQLQQMMESVRSAGADSSGAQALAQQMRGLMARQHGVMNQTAAASITSAILGADQLRAELAQLASEQQTLRQALRDLPRSAGSAEAMGIAGQAMGDAAGQLRAGAPRAALSAQGRAMDALQKSLASLQQQAGATGRAGQQGGLFDPLGRFNGAGQGPEFKMPVGADPQQLQEIRRILQMRAADPARSPAERAYILRLLRQF